MKGKSVPQTLTSGQHSGVYDPVGVGSPVLPERNGKALGKADGPHVPSASGNAQESEESLQLKIDALTERNDRVDSQLKRIVTEMESDGPNHSIVAKGYLVNALKIITEEKEKLLHFLKMERGANERFMQEATDTPSRKRKADDDSDKETQSTVTRARALRGVYQDPVVWGSDSGATLSRRNDDNREEGGKPGILLYPPEKLEASVRLELCFDWSFSSLYPKPLRNGLLPRSNDDFGSENKTCEWRVCASPDGSLLDLETRKVYLYLSWEALSKEGRVTQRFDLKGAPSFCVAGGQAGEFLDDALKRLGLSMRERCGMITYWLPQLEAFPFNEIYFVDAQRYGETAKLDISPCPDVIIRVFMAFRGIKTFDAELGKAELDDLQAPTREGFVVVEWGGMNLNGPAVTH